MKNPEPLHIRHLSVGVLGGVQPEKLSVIIDGPDDGLASRLLWAWPDAPPEFSLARTVPDDAPAQIAFARLTDLAMGSDQFGHPEPKSLRLTPKAEDVLEQFARDMARRAHDASGLFAGTSARLVATLCGSRLCWSISGGAAARRRQSRPASRRKRLRLLLGCSTATSSRWPSASTATPRSRC